MSLPNKCSCVFAALLLISTRFTTPRATTLNSSDLPICKGRAIKPCEPFKPPRDCYDIKQLCGDSICSGLYYIFPNIKGKPLQVYCDMETDGGGWLVFQRREDGSVNFTRNWEEYKNGFGNVAGEFWLGNEYLHEITQFKRYELRVDVEDFELSKQYAKYNSFRIQSEATKYTLTLGTYRGSAGDSLAYHSGMKFTTSDSDNDRHSTLQCADYNQGAWWYNACAQVNLNGEYLSGPTDTNDGVFWQHFKGLSYSLKETEMKIRPYGA